MSIGFCDVNRLFFLFQGFIPDGNKEMDTYTTIMIAVYLCTLHLFNLINNDMGVSIQVSRAVAIIALVFVALRLIDLYYC